MPTSAVIIPLRPVTTYASAHPALRSVPAPTRGTVRGANATEVNAVAELIERIAPEVTVRSVSRKADVYVVKAVAHARTRIYRIPIDMLAPSTTQDARPSVELKRAS